VSEIGAEVRAQRVRNWQRARAGSLRGGRRPSLPDDAELRWFLKCSGYALNREGRVTLAFNGRLGTLDVRMVRRAWDAWSQHEDWRDVPTWFRGST
jgi:hypothetical protein